MFLTVLAAAVSGATSSTPTAGGPPRRGGGPGPRPRLDPVERLGRALFFDTALSNPPGVACASCHAPEAGFSYPGSAVNQRFGPVPGAVADRFGSRKPMTVSYAWFAPDGPTVWRRRQRAWTGGFFADGRADSLEAQAIEPLLSPNEMDNVAHGLGSPEGVVRKVLAGRYTDLLKAAFGDDVTTHPSADLFRRVRQALSAYERSREVSPFSSKYDAVLAGQARFTPSELNGLRLFTGSTTGRPGGPANARNARCVTCHAIADADDVANDDRPPGRRDFFTNWTYANVGVPRNPRNPFYQQTRPAADPQGYNPDGAKFVDLGLGGVLYPARHLPPGNVGGDDFLAANGTFRVPSLRNVDKRPDPAFVKCYMHNGVLKSLKQVVHFYNTRNLTTAGDAIDLADPTAPTKGRPLWPPPEWPSPATLQNPAGRPNAPAARVGHLGLTGPEEDDLVAFLRTLSDGYFTPQRRPPPPPD